MNISQRVYQVAFTWHVISRPAVAVNLMMEVVQVRSPDASAPVWCYLGGFWRAVVFSAFWTLKELGSGGSNNGEQTCTRIRTGSQYC